MPARKFHRSTPAKVAPAKTEKPVEPQTPVPAITPLPTVQPVVVEPTPEPPAPVTPAVPVVSEAPVTPPAPTPPPPPPPPPPTPPSSGVINATTPKEETSLKDFPENVVKSLASVVEESVQGDNSGKKGSHGFLWVLVGLVIGVGIGGTGVYLAGDKLAALLPKKSQSVKTEQKENAATTPTPTTAKTTETGTSKREDLSIQILNGSGVKGAAKVAADYMEGLGYKITETGNADTSDYAKTVIAVKTGKKEYVSLLTDDLSKKYTLSAEVGELPSSSTVDAKIIIGKK
jgi:hypothetical protein